MTTTRTTRHYKIGSYQCRAFGSKVYSLKRIKQSTIASFNFRNCKKFPITIVYGCSSSESFVGRTRRQALLLFNRKYPGQDYYLLTGECRIEKTGIRIFIISNQNNSQGYSVFLPLIDLSRYQKIKFIKEYEDINSIIDESNNISFDTLKPSKDTSSQVNNFSKVAGFLLLVSIGFALAQSVNSRFENNDLSKSRSRNAAIVVNSTIYDSLETQIDQWKADRESLGWSISKHIISPSSPEALRDTLTQIYEQDSISSAMLVGNFPFEKFQSMSSGVYQEFPMTTFYEGVEGDTWQDNYRKINYGPGLDSLGPGQDSILDTHRGNRSIEFSLGILDASNLTFGNDSFGNEIQRLMSYFQRNHAYVTHNLNLNPARDTALLYTDDEVSGFAHACSSEIVMAYPNLLVVSDSNTTTAEDFAQRLQIGHELIQLGCHGLGSGYNFTYNNGTQIGVIINNEIPGINPQSLFYIINSCYTCDLNYDDAIGKHVLFSSNKSLAELGYTARAPPPYNFVHGFWDTLAVDSSFGNAYKKHKNYYLNRWAPSIYHNPDAYALVYLGDPTLKIKNSQQQPYIEELVNNATRVNNLYEVRPSIITNGKLLVKAFTVGEVLVNFYSVSGQLYERFECNIEYQEQTKNFNISRFPTGVYFVQFQQKDKPAVTKKILITR